MKNDGYLRVIEGGNDADPALLDPTQRRVALGIGGFATAAIVAISIAGASSKAPVRHGNRAPLTQAALRHDQQVPVTLRTDQNSISQMVEDVDPSVIKGPANLLTEVENYVGDQLPGSGPGSERTIMPGAEANVPVITAEQLKQAEKQ